MNGLAPNGQYDARLLQIWQSMKNSHYDDAIPFNWADASRQPVPGMAMKYGNLLATTLVTDAQRFNGPVDFVLIGHSRGAEMYSAKNYVDSTFYSLGPLSDLPLVSAVQIATVFRLLFGNTTQLEPVLYWSRLAFADAEFRRTPNHKAKDLLIWFQKKANDPQVVLPAIVNYSEVFYQTTPSFSFGNPLRQFVTVNLVEAAVFNLWGQIPVIKQSTATLVRYINVTSPTIGHDEVVDWYRRNVMR